MDYVTLNRLKNMKKSTIVLGCLLATTSSTAWARMAKIARPSLSITFNCLTRGSGIKVALKSKKTYTATSKVSPLADGIYTTVGPAYRFKTGGLKGQSIVRQQGNYYLVETQSEAQAARLAAADGALFCTKL